MREIIKESGRPIRFRAWDKETKQLLKVNSLTLDFGLCDLWNGKPEDEGVARKLSDVNLMQYTGLKDKNGVMIFEGDVVMFPNLGYDPSNGDDPMLIEQVRENDGAFSLNSYLLREIETEDREVIGDIYQHPELLK